MSESPNRSFERITKSDLRRLAQIALDDLEDLCRRQEYSRPYRKRLRIVCLCQGAARHCMHGDRGVQDFDLWGFYEEIPEHPFPCRRRGTHDFGPSKFGRNPEDGAAYAGRRVDVMGRSIHMRRDPIEAVCRYLDDARTTSARLLAAQPVVGVWPVNIAGQVIWPGIQRTT